MSELVLLVYRDQTAAFAAGESMAVMQRAAGCEPEDIVVVTRDASGRVAVQQSIDLATGRPLGGGRWGILIGMLFLDGRKPMSPGKGLAAQLRQAGLDATFLQTAMRSVEPGGAVVGLRVRLLGVERVLDQAAAVQGSPTVLRTRLSAETEDRLADLLAQIPQPATAGAAPDGMF